MRWISTTVVALLLGTAMAADEKPVTFGKADLGKVPAGWTAAKTGKGEGSVWKVTEDSTAPGKAGFVLSQTAVSPGPVFNRLAAN